jgi:sulfur-oxidizing protein SoxY
MTPHNRGIGEAFMCMRPGPQSLLCGVLGLFLGSLAQPAFAGPAWTDIGPALFGTRVIEDGRGVLTFGAPYRAVDQRAVPISVDAGFADGRTIKSVTLVVDENPMPVAAVFRLAEKRDRVSLGANLRLDQASPVRVIVEASDDRLYMAETFVKASGLGVCAAPPLSDQTAGHIGEMRLTDLTCACSGEVVAGSPTRTCAAQGSWSMSRSNATETCSNDEAAATTRYRRRAQLDIRHPQNTGLQMNQITMLYVPLRFISAIEIRQGEQKLFDLDGSMSLSENPRIWFDYRLNGAARIRVEVRDTDGAAWTQDFPVGSGS